MHFLKDSPLAGWLRANRAWVVNLYLFINIAGYTAWQGWALFRNGHFGFVEAAFIAQNIVLAGIVLIRRDHQAIDADPTHQLVALAAFFSGAAFVGQPGTGDSGIQQISQGIIVAANLLGIATLFNLGRSFGILIACRGVQTGGLYRLIRHPMYLSDILLRVGFTVSHFSILTVALALLSIALYIYRARLEEAFLVTQPGYRDYMNAVRYRLLPGIF
jgi:protein-S-isoprenylcysteine O-methyltransferase Ste14